MIPDHLYIDSFPTGSNYICNPPVTNTDIDQMFLVYNLAEVEYELEKAGWTRCGVEYKTSDKWSAWRSGNNNALLTHDKTHYDLFEAATELAKKRNLLSKKDRVALFNTIMGVK